MGKYSKFQMNVVKLYYDPSGRIFRKEEIVNSSMDTATHYFYKGNQLVQEFDEMGTEEPADDLTWDYLRAPSGKVLRRRDEDGDNDYLHFNNAQGTVVESVTQSRTDSRSANGYAVEGFGEPLPMTQPSAENHIRYQGGFLEDKEFTTGSSERGYFYRMGVRHYSPALGRFIQRDPLSYMRVPGGGYPLGLNPYIYALNQPYEYSDTSGLAPCCGGGGGGKAIEIGGGGAEIGGNFIPSPSSGRLAIGDSEGNVYHLLGCAIAWPQESYCYSSGATTWPCCLTQDGTMALYDPCDQVTGIPPTPTGESWSACECYEWCYEAAEGGENHPSSASSPTNYTGVINGPLGPPNIGQTGTWGNPWEFLPKIPDGFDNFHPDIGKYNNSDHSNLSIPIFQNLFDVDLWGWYWGRWKPHINHILKDINKGALIAVLAEALLNAALSSFCSSLLAKATCQSKIDCLTEVCCIHRKCWKDVTVANVLLGIAIGLMVGGGLPGLINTVLKMVHGQQLVCAILAALSISYCLYLSKDYNVDGAWAQLWGC